MGALENKIDKIVSQKLEEMSLEEFFEGFDLTPTEVVTHLYNAGIIDLDEELFTVE